MDAHQIAAKIEGLIASGAEGYQHKNRLLSVRNLGEAEGVSAQTAAAAYSLLEARGLVTVSNKSGTYVSATKAAVFRLGSFDCAPNWDLKDWEVKDGSQGVMELEKMAFEATDEELATIGREPGTRVVVRHYRKLIDGVSVQHKAVVLPYDLASTMPQDENYEGLPPMMTPIGHPLIVRPEGRSMHDWLGWDCKTNQVRIKNVAVGEMAAKVLGVPVGTPGLAAYGTIRDSAGDVMYTTILTGLATSEFVLDHLM